MDELSCTHNAASTTSAVQSSVLEAQPRGCAARQRARRVRSCAASAAPERASLPPSTSAPQHAAAIQRSYTIVENCDDNLVRVLAQKWAATPLTVKVLRWDKLN